MKVDGSQSAVSRGFAGPRAAQALRTAAYDGLRTAANDELRTAADDELRTAADDELPTNCQLRTAHGKL